MTSSFCVVKYILHYLFQFVNYILHLILLDVFIPGGIIEENKIGSDNITIYTIQDMTLDAERALCGCHDAIGEVMIDEYKWAGTCGIRTAALT